MSNEILKQSGANFYGFESIDHLGKHHYHPAVLRGSGDLQLTKDEVRFNQWISQKEYHIPLEKVTRVEIRTWHNLKMKWPGKVLRIHFKEGDGTKIFGIALGGILSTTKGLYDDVYLWKEKIESMCRDI